MQDHPPDILITNFSMLGVMLMRDSDSDIFEKTKRWLEQDGSVFHLIIDELHLHRGTAGTEVAYLVKLLLLRLGLSPSSPKLRIIGSSASLEADDDDSLTFLSSFFGSNWDSSHIIPGNLEDIPKIGSSRLLPSDPFVAIAGLEHGAGHGPDGDAVTTELLRSLDGLQNGEACQLEDVLESDTLQVGARMLAACSTNGITRGCLGSRRLSNSQL